MTSRESWIGWGAAVFVALVASTASARPVEYSGTARPGPSGTKPKIAFVVSGRYVKDLRVTADVVCRTDDGLEQHPRTKIVLPGRAGTHGGRWFQFKHGDESTYKGLLYTALGSYKDHVWKVAWRWVKDAPGNDPSAPDHSCTTGVLSFVAKRS